MPKTFTAQNVVSVNPLRFLLEDDEVVGIVVDCEVNYGELGMTHQIDIWDELTADQQYRAQQVYDFIKNKVEQIIME